MDDITKRLEETRSFIKSLVPWESQVKVQMGSNKESLVFVKETMGLGNMGILPISTIVLFHLSSRKFYAADKYHFERGEIIFDEDYSSKDVKEVHPSWREEYFEHTIN